MADARVRGIAGGTSFLADVGHEIPTAAILSSLIGAATAVWQVAVLRFGAIVGPLLALGLVGLVGTRTAIALSIIPGLHAALAIVYWSRPATTHAAAPAGGWPRAGAARAAESAAGKSPGRP